VWSADLKTANSKQQTAKEKRKDSAEGARNRAFSLLYYAQWDFFHGTQSSIVF
jgi:hypothetical protein